MKILVVDDNHLLSMILADHLRERGHRVVPAYNGELALAFCNQTDYDWLVIDLVLPELGGIDVLERLREENQTFRAIIITGFPELLEKESPRLEALGVEAVIQKPFSFSDVHEVVERCH